MHPEVSDLLLEAKADAPPARLGVDDVVAAGRRRRRRRHAGWAATVVGVVIITLGAPQVLTHRAAPPVLPPAGSPAPPSSVVRPPALTFTVRPYVAGPFRVAEPSTWNLAGESSMVRRAAGGPDTIGILTAFRPGADPFGSRTATTPTEPIGGRRAYFVHLDGQQSQLVWYYADDAVAALTPMKAGAMSQAEMRTVAAGFTRGPAEEVTIGFRAGYVPDGYRLVQVSGSRATFVPARDAVFRLSRPDRNGFTGEPDVLVIDIVEPGPSFGKPSTEPRCTSRQSCYLYTTAGLPVIMVNAPPAVPRADVLRTLTSVTRGTLPVTRAIPETARMK